MALSYDLREVKNFKKKLLTEKDEKGHSYLKGYAETIIFGTMFIGMNTITKDNWLKFYNRMRLMEDLENYSWLINSEGKRVRIKKADVKRMIGLKTNASNLTSSKFIKKFKDKI